MISLILSMIGARRGQAATLALLAAVAVAAAVAGPVAARATDAAVVRLEVANASDAERKITLNSFVDPVTAQELTQFNVRSTLVSLPGFDPIRTAELQATGPFDADRPVPGLSWIVFRERVCEHVTVVRGRCLVAAPEIIIGEDTARRTGLEPGDVAAVQAARVSAEGNVVPDGAPASVTVAGVYRPMDIEEPYWAGRRSYYFLPRLDGTRDEAVFMTPATMAMIDHKLERLYLDALAPASVLSGERLDGLADEIAAAVPPDGVRGTFLTTDLPRLAERVATSRESARNLGPVAFIPLVAISLFVIYLAVGYGMVGRREELGVVALRGASTRRRWLLATGETVVPMLVGAPVGYVLGFVGVAALARVRLGSTEGTELSFAGLPYAAAALLVALGVAFAGQRRPLAEPVVDQLRGVPPRRPVWRTVVAEALVGVLAVVATVQMRVESGQIAGLGLLVPGLLVVAVALLAARLLVPAYGFAAQVALRRGRLGWGLSAVQLARRPGSQRLFALLAVGTAMLAFVAAGADVAARAREERASVVTGADRVLTVDAEVPRLVAATHELDPEGLWAMVAAVLPPTAPDEPTLLAVDAARLATVAAWRPEFGADATAVAQSIAVPVEVSPLLFRGSRLEVDVETVVEGRDSRTGPPQLDLEFVTVPGSSRLVVPFRDLPVGRSVRTVEMRSNCAEGCRLVAVTIPDAQAGQQVRLRGIRQLDPAADVIPPAELLNGDRWRTSDNSNALLIPSRDALVIRVLPSFQAGDVRVGVVDAPLPVPVAVAGAPGLARLTSVDRGPVPAKPVATLSMLPRLGANGVLADLAYLDRVLPQLPAGESTEIWLGPAAPVDAAELFGSAGLAVRSEAGLAASRAALARQGPALALHFHVAAATFGIALALGGLLLVAAVDRPQRTADLVALRVQGLRRRIVRRAALWGYLSIVVLAAVTGLAGAAVAWTAAGDYLPIFIDTSSVLSPPRWPTWQSVLGPWAVAGLSLAATAVVVAWALRRATFAAEGGRATAGRRA